jgi:pantoate--beta-alanine ligase
VKVIKKVRSMQNISDSLKREGSTIGLVPTMGALHEGHFSLIKRCKRASDITVVSIFVNKLQFGPKEDFDKYPKRFLHDKAEAKKRGVDYIFAPSHEELYDKNFSSFVEVEGVAETLCGAFRPGHFKGVTTVVSKLFNIVKPDLAFFGEKDYQQLVAIKRMVADLNFDVKVVGSKIIREQDGLALSSRNAYLSKIERKKATVLYRALKESKRLFQNGENSALKIIKNAVDLIRSEGLKIDYVNIVDSDTLKDVKRVKGKALMAVAASIGNTRLIDNMILK